MTDGRKPRLDARAATLLVVCCALWGLNQVAVKLALPEVPPLLQAGLRSLGAAALLLLWSLARGLALFDRDATLRPGLLAGSLFAAEFGCIFSGLQFTTASRMTVFLYLAPLIVALGMPFIAHSERLSGSQRFGLALAFGGVVWAFAEGLAGTATTPGQWRGDALGIAAAVMWAMTTLTLRGSRLSGALPEKTLLYQLAVAGLALTAASVASGEAMARPWADLSALSWAALAYQTVVVTFASYLAWFWLMRHYPATRLASFTLLTPVFGLLAGVGLLGEPLTLRLVVAVTAVCAGIWQLNRQPG